MGDRHAKEQNAGSWFGLITYTMNHNNNFAPAGSSLFFADGYGHNITCRNLTNPLSGSNASSITYPEYLEQYFDTAANKMLTYNGQAWV
jgi:hypothetical protein